MDHRSAIRVEVNGQVSGRMVLVEYLEILDISMTGIRFNCMRRIDMNCPHKIRIEKNNISVTLKGMIVRSSFKGLHQKDKDCMPVYEVGMHFENMSDEDTRDLEQLISILYHD